MSIEQGPSPEEMGIKQEKKVETGLGDLLELAQEVQTAKQTPEETIEEKTEELKTKEQERGREQEMLKDGTEFALGSGKLHYLELTNPDAYLKAAKEESEQHRNDPNWDWRKSPYELSNRVAVDGLNDRLPGFNDHISMGAWGVGMEDVNLKSAKGYLPAITRAYKANIEYLGADDADKFLLLKEGRRKQMFELIYQLKPEEKAELDRRLPELIQRRTEMGNLALRKHAEGFGRAALEAGDVAVAVDNLDAAGILENPEIIAALKTRMIELKASTKPEDKLRLRKTSEKLLAIQARKTAEAQK